MASGLNGACRLHFGRQQARIDDLWEEQAALRDCLVDIGLLSPQVFLAQLHKRRFAAARQRHPFQTEASLAEAMGTSELVLTMAHSAGFPAMRALLPASRRIQQA